MGGQHTFTLVIMMRLDFPVVVLSDAEILRIPVVSMSKTASRRGKDAGELELAEKVVATRHLALTPLYTWMSTPC